MNAIIAASITAGAALVLAFFGVILRIHNHLGRLEKGLEILDKGQAELRADNAALREQMRLDNQESREQMRLQEERLREEMRANNQQLREELRSEVRESNQQLREEMRELIRSEGEQTRNEIRRLAEALAYHYHDADGTTVFRIPPPTA